MSASTTVTNTVRIYDDGASGGEIDTTNNESNIPFTLLPIIYLDLQISNMASPTTTSGTSTLLLTYTYTNSSTVTSTGVTISTVVPTNTVFYSASSSGAWSCADGAVAGTACNVSIGTLGPTSTSFVILAVQTIPTFTTTTVTNTVTIADDGSYGTENVTTNNSSSSAFTMNGLARASIGDLVWLDLDADGVLDGGEPGVSGVTIARSGQGADNTCGTTDDTLDVTTTTDANGNYIFADLFAGSYCIAVTDTGNVLSNYSQTTATTSATTITVTAGVTNVDTDFGYRAIPELVLTKTAGSASITPGDSVTFTLLYSNTGSTSSENVIITETVPTGATFSTSLSAPTTWSCADGSAAATTCTTSLGTVVSSTSGSVSFAVTSLSSFTGSLSNTASITDDGTNGAEANLANNTSTASVTVSAETTSDSSGGGFLYSTTINSPSSGSSATTDVTTEETPVEEPTTEESTTEETPTEETPAEVPDTAPESTPSSGSRQVVSAERAAQCTSSCEDLTLEFFIVVPDGSRRWENRSVSGHIQAVRTYLDQSGACQAHYTVGFEDQRVSDFNPDFDYNDIVIDVSRTADGLTVTPLYKNAAWDHQIGVAIYRKGEFQEERILFTSSQTALTRETNRPGSGTYTGAIDSEIPASCYQCQSSCETIDVAYILTSPSGLSQSYGGPYAKQPDEILVRTEGVCRNISHATITSGGNASETTLEVRHVGSLFAFLPLSTEETLPYSLRVELWQDGARVGSYPLYDSVAADVETNVTKPGSGLRVVDAGAVIPSERCAQVPVPQCTVQCSDIDLQFVMTNSLGDVFVQDVGIDSRVYNEREDVSWTSACEHEYIIKFEDLLASSVEADFDYNDVWVRVRRSYDKVHITPLARDAFLDHRVDMRILVEGIQKDQKTVIDSTKELFARSLTHEPETYTFNIRALTSCPSGVFLDS